MLGVSDGAMAQGSILAVDFSSGYLVYLPPYLARVSSALVFKPFGADVSPLHTSPTDIISYPGPKSCLN